MEPVPLPGPRNLAAGPEKQDGAAGGGQLTIPLTGGRYEGLLARRQRPSSTPGVKPWYGHNALKFMGNSDLETDFTGQFEGNLSSAFPYLQRPDLIKFNASGKLTFEISESVLVVLTPIPVAGQIINGLRTMPPVYDWIKDRAKFYVQFKPEAGGELTLNWGAQDWNRSKPGCTCSSRSRPASRWRYMSPKDGSISQAAAGVTWSLYRMWLSTSLLFSARWATS